MAVCRSLGPLFLVYTVTECSPDQSIITVVRIGHPRSRVLNSRPSAVKFAHAGGCNSLFFNL